MNLSSRSAKLSELPGYLEKSLIGGKGVATKLLLEIPPKIDPFHPENAVIFAIGPLNGLTLPGASRMTAVFKSPLTFGYGESQCGGFVAHEMAKSGVHFLHITGKAEKPVYIVVEDGSVEIKDASHLWGKDCYETEEILRKDEGGEVLCIGQAGENLVRFACITHRRGRQFGRCGAGAVMGSKKLKAIVIKGSGEIEVADPEALAEFRSWILENVVPKLESMRKYGTVAMSALTNEAGVLPTKYWQLGSFEKYEDISYEKLSEYVVKNVTCYGCVVACGKLRRAGNVEVEGPEYETLFALGSLCYVSDPVAVMRANDLCDRYGMDTISAGNVVAFYMACSERGEVEEKINFGDAEAVLELLRKIAFREGVGDVLAEGVRIAAQKLNGSVEPIHVRGLELPGYDPRGLYGMALAYVTSQRGACHMRSCAYRPNLSGAVDRLSPSGQAELVKELEDLYCVVDSLVFCRFLCLPQIGIGWEDVAKLLRIVGLNYDVGQLRRIGESIWRLSYEFNRREGVDFEVPKFYYDFNLAEPLRSMLEDYLTLRRL
ncbi:MAG: aldehyde ferredoxin oxidoreductase family protein [Archaeoglobaceae archaeon]